jgi:hypothetical protein
MSGSQLTGSHRPVDHSRADLRAYRCLSRRSPRRRNVPMLRIGCCICWSADHRFWWIRFEIRNEGAGWDSHELIDDECALVGRQFIEFRTDPFDLPVTLVCERCFRCVIL